LDFEPKSWNIGRIGWIGTKKGISAKLKFEPPYNILLEVTEEPEELCQFP
jgi:hypothetical protein